MPLQASKFSSLSRWRLLDGRWVFATSNEVKVLTVREPQTYGCAPLETYLPAVASANDTNNLLQGIIGAYLSSEPPIPPSSKEQYITMLESNYVIVSAIEEVLQTAIHSASRVNKTHLVSFLSEIYQSEQGHSSLIESDLEELGVSQVGIHAESNLAGAFAVRDLLRQLASSKEPQSILGVGYLLETNALAINQLFLDELLRVVPEAVNAISFLQTHSGVGVEADHVADLLEFISVEPVVSRLEIISACERAAQIVMESAALKLSGRSSASPFE
jgi:hypothetical protein